MAKPEAIETLTARLEAAARRVAEAEAQLSTERALRDQVVVEALDGQMSYRKVAQAAGLSQGQVHRIVVASYG